MALRKKTMCEHRLFPLPPCSSVFTAEIISLVLCTDESLIVFPDSTKQTIKNRSTWNPQVSILQFLFRFYLSKNILPSHVDISGNETTDKVTNQPIWKSYLPQNIQSGCIPATNYCSHIGQGFTTCWQKYWWGDTHNSRLWSVKSFVRPWQFSCHRSLVGRHFPETCDISFESRLLNIMLESPSFWSGAIFAFLNELHQTFKI